MTADVNSGEGRWGLGSEWHWVQNFLLENRGDAAGGRGWDEDYPRS